MQVFLGKRLYAWKGPGAAGVVTDTNFIRCYWPAFDEPTAIFAPGSSGLIVQGPPTPRNIIFPSDTVFADYHPDADSAACMAAMVASKGSRSGLVEATPEMIDAYVKTYQAEVAKLPKTAAVHSTRDDCHFLVHNVQTGTTPNGKPVFERYVAQLSKQAAQELCAGKIVKSDLDPIYCKCDDNPLKPTTALYQLDKNTGALVGVANVAGLPLSAKPPTRGARSR